MRNPWTQEAGRRSRGLSSQETCRWRKMDLQPSVPHKKTPFWLPALGPAICLPQQKPALSAPGPMVRIHLPPAGSQISLKTDFCRQSPDPVPGCGRVTSNLLCLLRGTDSSKSYLPPAVSSTATCPQQWPRSNLRGNARSCSFWVKGHQSRLLERQRRPRGSKAAQRCCGTPHRAPSKRRKQSCCAPWGSRECSRRCHGNYAAPPASLGYGGVGGVPRRHVICWPGYIGNLARDLHQRPDPHAKHDDRSRIG